MNIRDSLQHDEVGRGGLAVLGVVFPGEKVTLRRWAGIVLMAMGAGLVGLKR